MNYTAVEVPLAQRLRGESLDELNARRDLLRLGLSVIRRERRDEIKSSGNKVANVPRRHLDEYDAREWNVNVQLRAVLAALDERMPPGQQRRKNKPKGRRDG